MLVREVGELLRSIDSPSISNPNEKKPVASGLSCSRSLLAYVVVGLPTRMRPPECLLGSGRSQADTYDRRRKDPHFIAPGERKFDRGLERWKKRLGMDLGVFVRAVCGENRTYGNEGGSRLYV
ncbi:UNVERIFIED_CONTAM: hypothetical protein Sradi_7307600 [Sesamum radiatum]|uniref:Uncharacterized protein n=1 Tax=Sesamum radiatum TaxID=300843 RepID=A0AAW2I7T3_SESRA